MLEGIFNEVCDLKLRDLWENSLKDIKASHLASWEDLSQRKSNSIAKAVEPESLESLPSLQAAFTLTRWQ